MKRKSKLLAFLVVMCLVMCVYINTPAKATVTVDGIGFVATAQMDWNDGIPSLQENAIYNAETIYANLPSVAISFGYKETDSSELVYVPWKDITITLKGEKVNDEIRYSAYEDTPGLYDIWFSKIGDYTFTYEGDSITVSVDYPQVGFYSAPEKEDNYIDSFYFSDMNDNVFYVILYAPEDFTTSLIDTDPFTVFDWESEQDISGADLESFISYELVNTGVYKVTVNTEAGFEFKVKGVCENNNDSSDKWDIEMSMPVQFSVPTSGLVVKDWIEWDEESGSLFVPEEAMFAKEAWPELGTVTCYFAYLDSEEDDTPEVVSAEDLIITYEGEDASDLVTVSTNETNGELIDIKFTKTGEYVVSYDDGVNTSSVKLYVEFPMVGFYETPELTENGHLTDLFEYKTGDSLYMIINTKGATITDPSIIINDYYEDAIEYELVSEEDGLLIYEVTVTDDRSSEFSILGRCMCSWEGEEPYEVGVELRLRATDMKGRLAFTDGEAHIGYSGCYITEEEYNAGMVYYNNSTPIFWVHADTVQGVIDKLSAVSNGEAVLYEKVDFAGPNTEVDTSGLEITNTGYIYICISHHGDILLEDQYVSSSGNMKGILFTSGKDSAYSVHDKEDGFYIEDCVFNLDKVKAKIVAQGDNVDDVIPEALKNEGYVSRYKNKLYHVEKVDFNGHYYFTMDINNPVEYGTNESDKEKKMLDYLSLNEIWDLAETTPFFKYPEMHVNIYCDMKFTGRYEKLSVGFKEGYDYNATIFDQISSREIDVFTMEDLGGATTKEVGTTFVYDLGAGNFEEEDTTVWLYTIDSETVTSGSYEGEIEVAETPEPNAMPELTQEQKDAIEWSKKLTVDVKADEQKPEDIDKDVQAEIEKVIDDDSYSGITYIDLDVNASVDGVEKDGKKIHTPITELKAPMEITIDIPEHARKHGRKFKLVRHHEGKDGKKRTEVIEGKLSDDGKRITFKSNCFSTYAIAYDSDEVVKTTIDMSKVSWDYSTAFTYDGTEKKVVLKGLPEGVTATYTGNVATEVGKYTAKVTFVYDDTLYELSDVTDILSFDWEIKAAESSEATTTEAPTSANDGSTTSGGPKTGDRAPIALCVMLFVLSGAGVACMCKSKKKYR